MKIVFLLRPAFLVKTKTKQGNPLSNPLNLGQSPLTSRFRDNEKLWAFRQAFEDSVKLPADGFVIGEPVSMIEVDYDQRRLIVMDFVMTLIVRRFGDCAVGQPQII